MTIAIFAVCLLIDQSATADVVWSENFETHDINSVVGPADIGAPWSGGGNSYKLQDDTFALPFGSSNQWLRMQAFGTPWTFTNLASTVTDPAVTTLSFDLYSDTQTGVDGDADDGWLRIQMNRASGYAGRLDSGGDEQNVTIAPDTVTHFDIVANTTGSAIGPVAANTFEIFQDGVSVHSGAIGGSGELTNIGLWMHNGGTVGVPVDALWADNFVTHDTVNVFVPDPSTLNPMYDPANFGNWHLVENMSDEFDGPTLDSAKWHVQGQNGFYYSNFTGRGTWRYETYNAQVSGGMLRITTQFDPDPTDLNHPKAQHSTAGVVSNNTLLYGYMEIRARTTDAEVASAFWTTGKTGTGNCFNGEASCSELDIFEMYGRPTFNDPNRHRRYWSSIHDWSQPGGPTTWTDTNTYLSFDPTQGFHTYGIEWAPDFITFHVDGNVLRTVTRQQVEDGGMNGGVWAIDDPARIWVDAEIFEWMGVPPTSAGWSEDYEIDYVRTWRRVFGDANGDGEFNNSDIGAFVLALTNIGVYQAMYPNVNPNIVLDMNGDGVFNNGDIVFFVAALTGP